MFVAISFIDFYCKISEKKHVSHEEIACVNIEHRMWLNENKLPLNVLEKTLEFNCRNGFVVH